ncbi:acyltransferase family protein, partial [Komagataeibacter xylinus]
LLFISNKIKLPTIFVSIICIIPSFIFSLLISYYNPVADFFSPLTRFWEILFGATLLCLERNGYMRISSTTRSCISIAGGALILIALATFNNTSPYPGWRAMLPVLAGTLLIASGSNACINRWVLSFRPLVLIGVISYPLYLWHWPLLSYARILLDEPPPAAIRTGLLLASIVLAVVTYLLIEKPLRFGRHATGKMIGLCIGMAIMGIAGRYIQHHNGLPTRYVATHALPTDWDALLRIAPSVEKCTQSADIGAENWCYTDKREIPHAVLIGDSHADALYWSLANHSRPGDRWMLMGRPACAPMLGMERITAINALQNKSDPPKCAQFNQARLRYILQTESIHLVLIATAQRVLELDSYAPHAGEAAVANGAFIGLSNLITRLEEAGKTVVFLEDNPDGFRSNKCALLHSGIKWLDHIGENTIRERCEISYSDYLKKSSNYHHIVAELQAAHPKLIVYHTAPILCDIPANKCERLRNSELLYSHSDHLSTTGADYIAADLIKLLNY